MDEKQYINVKVERWDEEVLYEVFDSLEEAIKDGTMYGCDLLPLTEELIELIKSSKVIKTDNSEYVQIIYLKKDTEGKKNEN